MDDIDIHISVDDDGETIGGVEIGEMFDTQNTNNDVSTAASDTAAALEDPQTERNAYGKAPRAKKSIVHLEMVIVELSDGTKKWKCQWCGSLYTYYTKYKITSNGKKYLEACLQRKWKLSHGDKKLSQSKLSIGGEASTPILATWQYNHAKVRELTAHMILGHEFPFTIMEGIIFNKFLKEIYRGIKGLLGILLRLIVKHVMRMREIR
ncbi:hypothetical protein LIER_42954 [Lithospermum erythrorhizon]|uniref:BED-type domain-containing protein n=1 Tax=Lithospermum erythrorhizon TaxID=34254 RepID=A0AAV3P8A4_LITER